MARTITRLAALGITPWLVPRAGLFVWCRLPDGADATDVAHASLKEGVVLAPGNAFCPSQRAAGFLRFNVAQSTHARILDVLARAMAR